MNTPKSNPYAHLDYPQQEAMPPTPSPSKADLLLMAKLFSLGDNGDWVRMADVPTTEPAKRVLRSWVRKGYVHYTQCPDTKVWTLILEAECARMCGEAITAAFEVRAERSMLDKKIHQKKLFPRVWLDAAALAVVAVGMLAAIVGLWW